LLFYSMYFLAERCDKKETDVLNKKGAGRG
jgi:hypothetical protein